MIFIKYRDLRKHTIYEKIQYTAYAFNKKTEY